LVEGTPIGIGYGSCGSAAFLRKKIEVENIHSDPYWEKYFDLIKDFPMKSCWSYPIIDSKQILLGTFAVYHNTFRKLTKPEELSIQRVQTILVHIIEKFLSENVAKSFRDKLELIFNASKDIVFLISVKPGIEIKFDTVNNEFLRMAGLERNQVEGKLVKEVIPDPAYSRVIHYYQKAIDSGETVNWEETVQFPSGYRTGLATISPVYDKNKTCINLIGSVHDITDRKMYEVEIKQAYDELTKRIRDLNEKNKMLEDIAWVQSHKVRAPLARILGLIDLLNINYEGQHEMNELLNLLKNSSVELDSVIKEIVLKSTQGF
jgi:PAS domain S-box-containing protein